MSELGFKPKSGWQGTVFVIPYITHLSMIKYKIQLSNYQMIPGNVHNLLWLKYILDIITYHTFKIFFTFVDLDIIFLLWKFQLFL